MSDNRTIFVHAYDYSNPPTKREPTGSVGGGGFDWFRSYNAALTSYLAADGSPYHAQVIFAVQVPVNLMDDEITLFLEEDLDELAAQDPKRIVFVGDKIRAYFGDTPPVYWR